jgi:hypothetical protein
MTKMLSKDSKATINWIKLNLKMRKFWKNNKKLTAFAFFLSMPALSRSANGCGIFSYVLKKIPTRLLFCIFFEFRARAPHSIACLRRQLLPTRRRGERGWKAEGNSLDDMHTHIIMVYRSFFQFIFWIFSIFFSVSVRSHVATLIAAWELGLSGRCLDWAALATQLQVCCFQVLHVVCIHSLCVPAGASEAATPSKPKRRRKWRCVLAILLLLKAVRLIYSIRERKWVCVHLHHSKSFCIHAHLYRQKGINQMNCALCISLFLGITRMSSQLSTL